jgi:catalase
MSPKPDPFAEVAKETLSLFDQANGGLHPGFRPAHAKGILIRGRFTPASGARSLTSAPHLQRESTPVSVRFSDFAGVPAIPDNDPNASPRGVAIRFHLAEHVHTDIIGHSVDGFPARTLEEFLEFLKAAIASGPGVAKPLPIEKYLGAHPAALAFVQAPKPVPPSFVKADYFAVNAYKFTNAAGEAHYGRYRIHPLDGTAALDAAAIAAASPDFLFDEIAARLSKGPAKMGISVRIAAEGDVVDDATAHWPSSRPETAFGTIELLDVLPDNDAEQRRIIFDPIPRVDGIESSGDPLLEPRASIYLMSGRRRRSAQP